MLPGDMRPTRRQNIQSVKRSLFGSVDHKQMHEDLQKELEKISEEKSKTWNFDFKNFKPLPPGRYKWERVGKRLQTRRSPTESVTAITDSHSPSTQERPAKRPRYNLRTRDRDAENEFRPIELPTRTAVARGEPHPGALVETVSKTGSMNADETEGRTSRRKPNASYASTTR